MPLPALQLLEREFEKQRRLFELKKGAVLWLVGDPHPGAMRVRALLPPGGT